MNILKNKIFKTVGVMLFVLIAGWYVKNMPSKAEAIGDTPLMGYAWSENIGWVSFNSKNCDLDGDNQYSGVPVGCPASGTAVPYAVILKSDLKLEGYAWSDNIGWVYFGQTDLPANGAVIANALSEPKVWSRVQTNGTVVGWAKALAGGTTGSGGWDGWIKFSKATTDAPASGDYSVNYNSVTGKFGGYAWGSDVIGWLAASGTAYAVNNRPDGCAINCEDQPSGNPEITFWATPDVVEYNASSELSWSTNRMAGCMAANDAGDDNWNGAINMPSGNNIFTSEFTGAVPRTYTFTCDNQTTGQPETVTRQISVRDGFSFADVGDLSIAWPSGSSVETMTSNDVTLAIDASAWFEANTNAEITLSVDGIFTCDNNGENCNNDITGNTTNYSFAPVIGDNTLLPSQYVAGTPFHVTVGRGTPAGWYSFRINAVGGGESAVKDVRLNLTGNSGGVIDPDFYKREYD